MTKNKKQKKQFRARQERTGERYTTARRALLSQPEPFRAIVRRVIACASRTFELEELLLSLSAEHQQKLRTLMYFGRDHDEETEDDIRGLHKSLRRMDEPEYGPVDNMMDKAPLAEYLSRGLRKCDSAGIDLERTFGPSTSTPADN